MVTAQNAFGVVQARSDAITAAHPGPTALGRLRDLTYGFNSGVQVLNAFPEFTGDALTFSVTGEGVSVDPETGLVRILTDALREGLVVTVTASNSGGTASSSFQVTVTATAEPEPQPEPQPEPEPSTGMPPTAVGAIADVIFAPNSGLQSISSQAHFAGEDLVYSLDAAPEGVTIHEGSGLVVIATEKPFSEARVTVRAGNAAGFALQSFSVTVNDALVSPGAEEQAIPPAAGDDDWTLAQATE